METRTETSSAASADVPAPTTSQTAVAAPTTSPPTPTKRRAYVLDNRWSAPFILGLARMARTRLWLRWGLFVLGGAGIISALVMLGMHNWSLALWTFLPSSHALLAALYADDEYDLELQKTPQEPRVIEQQAAVERATAQTPEEAIELDAKRLGAYYAMNLDQAKSSFRAAIFAMLLGFTTIIVGTIVYWWRGPADSTLAALSAGAGLISNMLGGVFLHLNRTTQEQSLTYFASLDRAQKLSVAIKLAGSDPNHRSRIIEHLLAPGASAEVRAAALAPASAGASAPAASASTEAADAGRKPA